MLPSLDAAETIHALADSLTIAIRHGSRIECRTTYRKLISEGQAGLELLRQRPPTKTERCKLWLIELLATVPREAKLVYREGKALGFNERLIRRAMKRAGAVSVRAGRRKTHKAMIYMAKELREMLSGVGILSEVEADAPSPSARPTTKTKPFTSRRFEVMRDRAAAEQPLCNPDDAPLPDKDALSHGIGMHSLDQSSRKVVAESEWDRQEKRWDDHKKQWVPKEKAG